MSTAEPTAAQRLAGYLATFALDDLPAPVVEAAVSCVVDTVGVARAGCDLPWARATADAVSGQSGGGRCTVIGSARRVPVAQAALINGTSAHGLEFDDANAQVHVGAAVVPAALAAAERLGATGRQLLEAVIAGYEASVRVAWAVPAESLLARGFHPTGVCNVFGATAATGRILGLDPAGLANAFGIAGSMSSGIAEFYADGTMTKRLHAGIAAQSGVNAAWLASCAVTGPATVFEGTRGVLHAFVDQGYPERLTEDLGERHVVLETAQKRYPVNFAIHAPIEAVLMAMGDHRLVATDIASVEALVRPFVADLVGSAGAYRPPTLLAAQMSLPFGVAVAAHRGTLSLGDLDDTGRARSDILAMAAKVRVGADRTLDHEGDGDGLPTRLRLTTTDGRELEETSPGPVGRTAVPLAPGQLDRKFLDCVEPALGEAGPDLLRLLRHLPEAEGIAPVMELAGQCAGSPR